jgi:hypothetical protein
MRAGWMIGAEGQCRALCRGDEAMQCLGSQPSVSRGTRRIAVSVGKEVGAEHRDSLHSAGAAGHRGGIDERPADNVTVSA